MKNITRSHGWAGGIARWQGRAVRRLALFTIWLTFLAALAPAASAEVIWTFEGEFEIRNDGPDQLGIAGETYTHSLTFDDATRWENVLTHIGWELFAPASAATATITGNHTISLVSPAPAARIRSLNNASVPAVAVGVINFMHYVIDGATSKHAAQTDGMVPPVIPTDGDLLIADHLSPSFWDLALIDVDNDKVGDYTLINGRVSITTTTGPSLLSDLTGNGFVDFEDLTVLLANWNQDVTADDGNLVEPLVTLVDFEDLTVLLADWTGPKPADWPPEAAVGAEAVPEPSTMLLLVIATLGLSFRRRRAISHYVTALGMAFLLASGGGMARADQPTIGQLSAGGLAVDWVDEELGMAGGRMWSHESLFDPGENHGADGNAQTETSHHSWVATTPPVASTNVTYFIHNHGSLTASQISRIGDAAEVWTSSANVTLQSVAADNLADIHVHDAEVIGTGHVDYVWSFSHNAAGYADGHPQHKFVSNRVAPFNNTRMQISMGIRDDWYTGAAAGGIGAAEYDYQSVATTEFGHILGLGHNGNPSHGHFGDEAFSPMNRVLFFATIRRVLLPSDTAAIQHLYGAPEPGAKVIWTFEGEFDDLQGQDLLGIDGETYTFSLTFDDTARWTELRGELFALSSAATATITGPHTISLKSRTPAARIRPANHASVPVEAFGNVSFIDFVIDGTTSIQAAFQDGMVPPVIPTDGDLFIADHLSPSFWDYAVLDVDDDKVADYELINGRVSIISGVRPSHLSDLSGNGFIDFEDLTILLANWNQDVTAAEGNLVEPLITLVNFEDLTVLLADWTGHGPAGSPEAALGAEAIPEPSTWVLVVIATLGLSICRRRRGRTTHR